MTIFFRCALARVVSGAILFCLVMGCGAAEMVKTPSFDASGTSSAPAVFHPISAKPLLPPAQAFGINIAADGTPSGLWARLLGAGWVRLELTHQHYDKVEASIARYRALGVKVLLLVDYTTAPDYPGWSPKGACGAKGQWATWRDEFYRRVEDVANRLVAQKLTDGVAWEIWNEPDHPLQDNCVWYNPGLPVATYADLFSQTAQIIRRTIFDASIIIGGMDSGNTSYVAKVVSAAAQQDVVADGVGVHPYGLKPNATWCEDQTLPADGIFCDLDATLTTAIQNYYKASNGLPVWITEFGINTFQEPLQAAYVTDVFNTVTKLSDKLVARAFYYSAGDYMGAPWGLENADASKKQAYDAYRKAARAASMRQ